MSHPIFSLRQALTAARKLAAALTAAAALTGLVLTAPAPAAAQTYQKVSATCSNCHQPVPLNSKVGDTCPHCGVTWGSEENHYEQGSSNSWQSSRPAAPSRRARRSTRVTSKTCDSCGQPVPLSSQIGDTCPHCGVRWTSVRHVDNGQADEPEADSVPTPAIPISALPRIGVPSSVAALKQRRELGYSPLPQSLRWYELRARKLVNTLPLVAQEAYYATLEDYATLDPNSQSRITELLHALAAVSPDQCEPVARAITERLRVLGTYETDQTALRARPHRIFLLLDPTRIAQ